MNKYIFPGADASCALNWVVGKVSIVAKCKYAPSHEGSLCQLETAGFEMRSIDVLGVHYSATIYRWYKNWLANEHQVVEKYGRRCVGGRNF